MGEKNPLPLTFMNFAAATQSLLGQVLSTFGEPIAILYTPAASHILVSGDQVDVPLISGSSPYSIKGVFNENYQAIDPNTQTVISSTHPVLFVRLSDLQTVPAKGDKVTIRGNRIFTVIRMEPDGGGGALLILHKG